VPPVYTDQRVAWRGLYPNNTDVPIRVEAGSYGGRPVYFRAGPDLIDPMYAGYREQNLGVVLSQTINVVLFVAALLGAAFMAQRNLQLNRGDRRGALRISVFVVTAMIASWMLQADHVPSADTELTLFVRAAGRAIFIAALCWLFYIALEPHLPPQVLLDRAAMSPALSRDAIFGVAPHAHAQALLSLDCLDQQLRTRPFLLGESFSVADAACFHPIWFMQHGGDLFSAVKARPALAAWFARIEGFGPGRFEAMTPADALAVARDAGPADGDERCRAP
jgi:hypothetical protein